MICRKRICSTSRRQLPAWSTSARVNAVCHVKTGKPTGSVVDRYRYPVQEVEIGRKGDLSMPGGEGIGQLVAHDRTARTIDIRKGPQKATVHPSAVFECTVISTKVQQEALLRFSEDPDARSCGADLLFRRKPRLRAGDFVPAGRDEARTDFAVRLATDLDAHDAGHSGPTWLRQDIRGRANDPRPGPRRQESGRHRRQPQGHLQSVGGSAEAERPGLARRSSMGRRCRAEDSSTRNPRMSDAPDVCEG